MSSQCILSACLLSSLPFSQMEGVSEETRGLLLHRLRAGFTWTDRTSRRNTYTFLLSVFWQTHLPLTKKIMSSLVGCLSSFLLSPSFLFCAPTWFNVIYHLETSPMSHPHPHCILVMSSSISLLSQGSWGCFQTARPQIPAHPPSHPSGSATGTAENTDPGRATAAGSSLPVTAPPVLALPGQSLHGSFVGSG